MSKSSARSEGDRAGRALFVGRFQPFHLGHLELIREHQRRSPREMLLVGIGSAQHAYTPENPFTAGERMEMLLAAAEEAHLAPLLPVPLLDIDRHALWVRYVVSLLPPFERVYTNNPLTRLLFEADGFEVVGSPLIDRDHLEGRRIREEMASGGEWARRLPPSVARLLERIHGAERVRLLSSAPRSGTGGRRS